MIPAGILPVDGGPLRFLNIAVAVVVGMEAKSEKRRASAVALLEVKENLQPSQQSCHSHLRHSQTLHAICDSRLSTTPTLSYVISLVLLIQLGGRTILLPGS